MFLSVVATKRSGHHAFIEWLCSGLEGSWVYFNNCFLRDGELYFSKIECGGGVNITDEYRVGLRPVKELASQVSADNVILSYENKPKDVVFSERVLMCEREIGGCSFNLRSDEVFINRVIFLRDFFNSFASQWVLCQRKPEKLSQLKSFIDTWSGLSGYFSTEIPDVEEGVEVYSISYNGFMFDEAVRSDFADSLGVAFGDLRTSLSKFGGGGNTMFGKPSEYELSQESLESRWAEVIGSPEFSKYIDDEILSKAKEFSSYIGRLELYSMPVSRMV